MVGFRTHQEGKFPPKHLDGVSYVWCKTGVMDVLRERHHENWFAKGNDSFRVNFSNGGYADIGPGDELWEALKTETEKYDIYVYVLTLKGGYYRWTGEEGNLGKFDCILIQPKGAKAPSNLFA